MFKWFLYFVVNITFIYNSETTISENPCVDNRKWRIIGGQTAAPGQFPFMAYLRNESNGFWGGASILNKNWMVTAAHCVDGYTTTNLSVVVGSNLLSTGGIPHNLSTIIMNPSYDPLTAENDIALLRVKEEIVFGDYAQPIEIGNGGEDIDNNSCVELGWGLVKWGSYPDELQFLPSRITPFEECGNYWESLVDTQVCALVGEGAGACCGDSGGPLVANGKLVGIMSYGLPCALGAPDLYTRVSAFADWIEDIVNSEFTNTDL